MNQFRMNGTSHATTMPDDEHDSNDYARLTRALISKLKSVTDENNELRADFMKLRSRM